MAERKPERPRDLSPQQLGFVRRPPVRWLSPRLLAGTAVRVVLAEYFGAYLDKRELQGALPAEVYRHDQGDDFWLDYVADLGDGFDATYSVAWLAAQPSLRLGGRDLPRANALVMGGDEVYPTASWRNYEDRCKGPYQAAFPVPPAQPPSLYALPGNHDWYDGLTAFLRLFGKDETFGGWQTRQARSYFAMRLPQRWWLLAIDSQLDAYIDDPQLKYFLRVTADLTADDRVIVCTPKPTWVQASQGNPDAYDTLDYFIRKVIEPTGARVPLLLSGDAHHYARYAGPDRQLITCGGGGAYLTATHRLPDKITVPPASSLVRTASSAQGYELKATHPSKERSRRYSWGVFTRLPMRSRGFVGLLGVVHTLLMLAYLSAGSRVLTLASVSMSALVLVSAIGFAMGENPIRRRRQWIIGGLHGVVHIGLGITGALSWSKWVSPHLNGLPRPPPVVVAVAGYTPVAALVATLVAAGYLLIASLIDVNLNELFAGQGIDEYKSFLRLHIAPDGELTIYPIALDSVGHTWQAAPEAAPDTPWIAPINPLNPRLAESPITLK